MNRFSLSILLLLSIHETFAQSAIDSLSDHNDYILNTVEYNKGIYKTFEEFKFNNPSISNNFSFDGKRLWLTDSNSGKNQKVKKREVWGFCDGSRIFVRRNKYNELLTKGRYCYFFEKGMRIVTVVSYFPPMILPIPVPYKDELIINYNNGKMYLLSKRLMKKILQTDDPELLKAFLNEPQKGKKLHQYILKYNERNVQRLSNNSKSLNNIIQLNKV